LIARIGPRLENLAFNPRPPGCKNLQGGDREWRIRVGDYRVVYTIDNERLLVDVTRILTEVPSTNDDCGVRPREPLTFNESTVPS
jgi:mRNA-degrading endonuclease RelE of RelBE toxin-antitoxin system